MHYYVITLICDIFDMQIDFAEHSPMYNKGRGISRMISDFIVSQNRKNQIEMYWAILKNHFRKINDQSNDSKLLFERIIQSRLNYMQTNVNHKIWSRFWRIVKDYNNEISYKEIMRHYFNSSDVIKSHRKLAKQKYD